MNGGVRLAVVSDRLIHRMGVRAALSGISDVQVVVEAHGLAELTDSMQAAVDAVVVDADLFRRHFRTAPDDLGADRVAHGGDLTFHRSIELLRCSMTARLGELTDRERETLMLLGRGLSNRAIASLLGLSEGTVKTHVGRVLAKLALESRLQAGLAALVHQLGRGDSE